MGFKQDLLASASLVNTASLNKYGNSMGSLDENQSVVSADGKKRQLLTSPLIRNIVPSQDINIDVGTHQNPITNLYVKNIYTRKDGINFVNNNIDLGKSPTVSKFNFNENKNEVEFLLNEVEQVNSSGSIKFPSTASIQEIIEISFVSNSMGFMDNSLKTRQGSHRTTQSTLTYVFEGVGEPTFSLTPSGGFYNTGSNDSEVADNFLQLINNFASGSVSQSVFPFTASISASNSVIITSNISGSKIANIANYISSSTLFSYSASIDGDGVIGPYQKTGSFYQNVKNIQGGKFEIPSASFSFKSVGAQSNKNILTLSSSEDIVQLGDETAENRFWKFKKDGRIVYSPSNSTDTFELNVSESLEFAKRENFGAGTKTSFSKTKGDTDESKRVTDVTNIRLPYNKGITLVNKAGVDTIGGFGITTTDLSSSRGDSNVENVIRFKGAGGFSFQNAIGLSYFHIDNVGNAAFGNTGIVGDHWGASANFHVTGSKTANIFRVSTDTDVINIKNNDLAVSGSLSVSGSIQGNMTTMTNHAYYDATFGERNWLPFTPFGTSETNMWTSSRDNTHRFIAPHNGQLKRVMIRNNHTATSSLGETKIALTIFPQLTGSEEAAKSVDFNTGVDFNFSASIFNKGDLLGVYVEPSGSPRYVNITCVWEYDTRS